ncbi:MAG: isoprenylcysteine carboxylmethyltransferase family protein [Promethearchaeota archaeon]|nr:MAG: isoprenylcysteine carboxylmethyltransferase family protein [Candidatus Lokiarchaeota archaeon]
MSLWFVIFLVCIFLFLPLHITSVSHLKLEKKFGKSKGKKIGNLLGMVSGWGFFLCLIGIWLSPQPRFLFPYISLILFWLPILNIPLEFLNILISSPFLIFSIWFGIAGVMGTGLEVSETHRTNEIIKEGIYSQIRHPQYLGAILSHIGMSILFAAFYSLLITPIIFLYNYLTAWKEEKELIKEFGKEYKNYKENVPMFLPKLRKS